MSRYLMRFIGGKYEGGVVHLPDSGEVGVGRAQELEICLVEDMVSRHHAKLEIHANKVILTDLGSTNGTFVNGERIQMCELENDDRVLFGTSILRLEDTAVLQANEPDPSAQPTRVVAAEAMSGALSDVSLTDLLQLLSGNGRSGVLTVTAPEGEAQLSLQEGRVGHISLGHCPAMAPIKVLSRMLTWREGQFVFADGAPEPSLPSLGKADELLMEAARQNDEANQLWPQLGGREGSVLWAQPLGGSLKDLEGAALDVLQLSWDQRGALGTMSDAFGGEDKALLHSLSLLLRDGFLVRGP